MKIRKDVFLKMIQEEVVKRFASLREAEVVDANKDNKEKEKNKEKSGVSDKKSSSPNKSKSSSKISTPKEPDPYAEPVDMPGKSPEADAVADSNGKGISDEIQGLTVLSLTMEPQSKVVPGAIELVLQFKESPHPLRVLIGKSGQVRFLYKNAIAKDLGAVAEPELPAASPGGVQSAIGSAV